MWILLYLGALFFALTPGVLITLPKGASKMTVALTHGAIFAVVWELTHRFVWRTFEGFAGTTATTATNPINPFSTAPAKAPAPAVAPKGGLKFTATPWRK